MRLRVLAHDVFTRACAHTRASVAGARAEAQARAFARKTAHTPIAGANLCRTNTQTHARAYARICMHALTHETART
eukprot:6132824-Pleurochrysis_carterae.AAC.3